MNALLEEIFSAKVVRTAEGQEWPLIAAISADEAEFLDRLIRREQPMVTLEVGLAYGCSALAILHASPPGSRHVAIDPHQHLMENDWRGIGMANLERAGFGTRVELIEEPSHLALPMLERRGERVDFAFIDGWHTFDHALVDFFGVDRILKVGGVVALDDADSYPAVRKLCRFIATNRSYEAIDVHGLAEARPSSKRNLLSAVNRRLGMGRLLRPEVMTPDRAIGLSPYSCLAFRKLADDERRWNHYLDF